MLFSLQVTVSGNVFPFRWQSPSYGQFPLTKTIYDFEWDPVKARTNARKHDVTFEQAATVFLHALALIVYDEANSNREDRWFTVGIGSSGRLLAVAHTYEIFGTDHARVRIISERKPTKHERQSYEEEPHR